MNAAAKFRIDSIHVHPNQSRQCGRCDQPAKHVLVILFMALKRETSSHKTSLCTECLQKMLMEDQPIAAAAIAQLFEERNEWKDAAPMKDQRIS